MNPSLPTCSKSVFRFRVPSLFPIVVITVDRSSILSSSSVRRILFSAARSSVHGIPWRQDFEWRQRCICSCSLSLSLSLSFSLSLTHTKAFLVSSSDLSSPPSDLRSGISSDQEGFIATGAVGDIVISRYSIFTLASVRPSHHRGWVSVPPMNI